MPRAKKRPRQEYQPRAHLSPIIKPKLSADQVREIRKVLKLSVKLRKAEGKTRIRPGLIDDLAKKYQVGARTIRHIRTGDRWSTLK